MNLFATLTQRLTDGLLAQLASASVLPLVVAEKYCAQAVPALVQRLAAPTDSEELNARWDMCRQLYLGQVLTDTNELLRTDMGWPDRRRYLAQKVLGPAHVVALAQVTAQPAQAETLLGYLTIITLATLGEIANENNLDPTRLGAWLSEQQVVPTSRSKAASSAAQPGTRVQAAAPAADKSSKKIAVLSVVSVLMVAGVVGGYFLLSTPANATQQTVAEAPPPRPAASQLTPATEVAPAPETTTAIATPQPTASVAVVPVAEVAAPVKVLPAHATGPVLRDTVGNAAFARLVGGKFNVAQGRYLKGEGQPLTVKLLNGATLTVGINSTESLLYKRLTNPSLPRPSDIALDRLAFDLGQARLGAEGAQQLGNIASLLKTFPKSRLLVVGHANNSEAQAIHLGLQRATTAVDELVKQGINASRLQAQGMLSTNLPKPNDSAESQAMLQGISLKLSRL